MHRPHKIGFLAYLLSLLLLTSCGQPRGEASHRLLIVGGSKADASDYASVIALRSNSDGSTFCSGTLVHPELIITSAHCLVGKKISDFHVHFSRGDSQTVKAMESYKAEQKFGMNFDIAWIRLEKPAVGYEPSEILRDEASLSYPITANALGYGQKSSACDDPSSNCAAGELQKSSVVIRQHLNEGRWFHLLLTDAEKGTGPCLGDSGGPLFITQRGKRFLAGNFVGWDRRLVAEDKRAICEQGQAVFNFTGAYWEWVERSSGLSLKFDERLNAAPLPSEAVLPVSDPDRFENWCMSRTHTDESWYTVQRLVSLAGDYALEHGGDISRIFVDCSYAKTYLEHKIRLDEGLVLEAFAPDSFGAEARIEDLSPIMALRDISIKKLVLSGHDIQDFTPIASLTSLRSLEITDNHGKVSTALDFHELSSIQNLTVRNSPGAVFLETLPSLHSLQTLRLENVRTEVGALALPGQKLTDLHIKADLQIILPELMPQLRELELSGLKSVVFAKKFPRLLNLRVDDSIIDAYHNETLVFDELPVLENLILTNTEGMEALILPVAMKKLKKLEITEGSLRVLSELKNLNQLTKVNVSKNRMSFLPVFQNLPSLQFLNVSDNPLTDLSGLSGLNNLRTLRAEHLDSGRWQTLGDLRLPQLTELRVGRNNFLSTKEFLRFPKIEVLVLSGNAIENIEDLAQLKHLSYLEVVDNPLIETKCPLKLERYCRFEWAK